MKHRLFSYKILEDRSFAEQIDDFSKNVDDLKDVDGPMKNEDREILLLNALPKSYQHLKDDMLFGRNAESRITYEEVQCALRSKELEKRSKHIDVKLHFVRDEVQKGEVRMLKISIDHNAADMLTKPLPALKFKYCQELVGLRE